MNTYKTLSVYKILQKSPIKSPLVRNIKSVPQIRLTRQRLYIPNKIALESTFNNKNYEASTDFHHDGLDAEYIYHDSKILATL